MYYPKRCRGLGEGRHNNGSGLLSCSFHNCGLNTVTKDLLRGRKSGFETRFDERGIKKVL